MLPAFQISLLTARTTLRSTGLVIQASVMHFALHESFAGIALDVAR